MLADIKSLVSRWVSSSLEHKIGYLVPYSWMNEWMNEWMNTKIYIAPSRRKSSVRANHYHLPLKHRVYASISICNVDFDFVFQHLQLYCDNTHFIFFVTVTFVRCTVVAVVLSLMKLKPELVGICHLPFPFASVNWHVFYSSSFYSIFCPFVAFRFGSTAPVFFF